MDGQIEFHLPLGLEIEGKLYKTGKMHLTTTMDELNVQKYEEVGVNPRYRDILLLASVIDEIGEIKDITKETILNLYEADFLYLQLLYNQVNSNTEIPKISCPACGNSFPIILSDLYSDPTRIK